jgi:hypothetical protein
LQSLIEKNKCNNKKNKKSFNIHLLYNKRACPTKNEPQQGISYLKRAREGGEKKREVGGRVSSQSYLRLG